MSEEFEKKLHPELAKRVKLVMKDLFDRGWNPCIPEVFGAEGTGYRSIADQMELRVKHPERSKVDFSFHNVTDAHGNPQAMAVHLMDRMLGNKLPKNHPFLIDLEIISERHGLRSGNSWKKPWDPLHVQLFEKDQLSSVKHGHRPPFLNSRLRLLPPTFKIHPPTTYLPPQTISNFNAGEKFYLGSNFPNLQTIQRPFGEPATYKHHLINDFPKLDLPEFGSLSKYYNPYCSPNPPSFMSLRVFQLRRPMVSGSGFMNNGDIFSGFKLSFANLGSSLEVPKSYLAQD